MIVVGVDTGGTFTDLVAWVDGVWRTQKILSTPANPALAVLHGLRALLLGARADLVTYASTVATNALLERRGARVVLLTTAGFEDLIEIGRQNRPALYDPEPHRPDPLVPRNRRLGIRERMLHDARVLIPLTAAACQAALRAVRRQRPEAIAICLLHAYANPAHERALARAVSTLPNVFCSVSHALVAEYREYERLSTTVINAYVGPVMQRHLHTLAERIGTRRLRVMQSNGGAISADLAGREAVRTVLSGPAGGVIGAWQAARDLGMERIITFDMGGTSTDVSLIDGALRYRTEWSIGGLPLRVPALDIHTVGAGGGSLARLDAGGALAVGPESAGADPGPACYGKGHLATVTDANVVLGRLVAGAFLGGRMRLEVGRARAAVTRLAKHLRAGTDAAAEGIVRVVNASMERAVRTISVERGHDPREYALVAFGGAAGQHACELGAALGITRIVVPRDPGLLSAAGAATATVQRDRVRTVRLTNPTTRQLHRLITPLQQAARRELRAEGVAPGDQRIMIAADVRYDGQSYEITLPVRTRWLQDFHVAHRRLYGYADVHRPVEVVNLRVTAMGRPPHAPAHGVASAVAATPAALQSVFWQQRSLRAVLHPRSGLRPGARLCGPALIAELSATTFVAPGWRARVHRSGHLVLTHDG